MLGTINGNPGGLIGLVHGKPQKNRWRNHSNWQLDEVKKIESTSTSLDIHVFFGRPEVLVFLGQHYGVNRAENTFESLGSCGKKRFFFVGSLHPELICLPDVSGDKHRSHTGGYIHGRVYSQRSSNPKEVNMGISTSHRLSQAIKS